MGKRRQFHCLDGVLRDLVAAVADDEGEGYERLLAFVRIIADILDVLDDEDVDTCLPDADDAAGGGGDANLELPHMGDSSQVGGPAQGNVGGSTHILRGPGGVESPMERVRHLASQAAGVPGHAASVDATVVRRDVVSQHTRRGG